MYKLSLVRVSMIKKSVAKNPQAKVFGCKQVLQVITAATLLSISFVSNSQEQSTALGTPEITLPPTTTIPGA